MGTRHRQQRVVCKLGFENCDTSQTPRQNGLQPSIQLYISKHSHTMPVGRGAETEATQAANRGNLFSMKTLEAHKQFETTLLTLIPFDVDLLAD